MKSIIKYRDYRIDKNLYTVKLTLLKGGSLSGGDAVEVEVMEWHLPPRNFWQRLSEFWKYSLSCSTWDPYITETSLDAYCVDKCKIEVLKLLDATKGTEEWMAI